MWDKNSRGKHPFLRIRFVEAIFKFKPRWVRPNNNIMRLLFWLAQLSKVYNIHYTLYTILHKSIEIVKNEKILQEESY